MIKVPVLSQKLLECLLLFLLCSFLMNSRKQVGLSNKQRNASENKGGRKYEESGAAQCPLAENEIESEKCFLKRGDGYRPALG